MSLIYVPALPTPQTEFNNSLPELLCSDDDSGNEDVLDMEYTEAESESLKRNAEVKPPVAPPAASLCPCSANKALHSDTFSCL